MDLDRRHFLIIAGAATVTCRCQRENAPMTQAAIPEDGASSAGLTSSPIERIADAGPVSEFAADRVYDTHRQDGFFVVRRAGQLFALSSVCTHKGCNVRVRPDASFICKCHASRFSADGTVLNGPAKRNLPTLRVSTDERGHLLVHLAQD